MAFRGFSHPISRPLLPLCYLQARCARNLQCQGLGDGGHLKPYCRHYSVLVRGIGTIAQSSGTRGQVSAFGTTEVRAVKAACELWAQDTLMREPEARNREVRHLTVTQ